MTHVQDQDDRIVSYDATDQWGGEDEKTGLIARENSNYDFDENQDSFDSEEESDYFDETRIGKRVDTALGEKTIGTFLSFFFLINQIYGPGVLAIPIVFQQSGVILTTLTLGFFMFSSAFASTLLCEAIAMIPGNQNFSKRIEFATAVQYWWGDRAHFIFQIFLNITLAAYLIASILITAQSLDNLLVFLAGETWGLEFYPNPGFHTYHTSGGIYGSSEVITLTVGYIGCAILVIPMGLVNLDSNVLVVQTGSFIFLVILLGEFIVYFFWEGLDLHRVPAFGSTYTQTVSIFIFSWSYVIFVPSWLNEKKDSVSVNRQIWVSAIVSFFGYLIIGLICAWSQTIDTDNMLTKLSSAGTPTVTRITTYLFSLGVIAPGIPVCSITSRYNLYVGHIVGRKQSYFWAVIAPWVVGFVFTSGQFFATFLNWTSLLFNGVVNFVIPFMLYLKARSECKKIPTTVTALPDWLPGISKHPRIFVIILTVLTAIVILFQIGLDFVYLVVFRENVLS